MGLNTMKRYRGFLFFAVLSMVCLTFSFFSFEACSDQASGRKPYEDYNVVLIFIDTLRADSLGCYGYERKTSPNIDEFAKESIVFEENFTPYPQTIGSFASLSTSLYPRSHGVFDIFKDKYPLRVKTLPEILKLYGYDTVWFAESVALHLEPGKERGYETIGGYDKNLKRETGLLINWLAGNKDKKFFLLFHTYKVHAPYFAGLKYKKAFIGEKDIRKYKEIIGTDEALDKAVFEFIRDEVRSREGAYWEMFREDLESSSSLLKLFERDFDRVKHRAVKKFLMAKKALCSWGCLREKVFWSEYDLADPDKRGYVKALYDAGILEVDTDFIGPIIKKLKSLGIYDKSIIVIFSDHGDEIYEHGGKGHAFKFYDELIHVPLIIRVPWIKAGKNIRELTQTVDIMPTILDLLGIPVPVEAQGKSLTGLINAEDPAPAREYAFGQLREISFIRSKEWKFILYEDGRKELYHLKSDPKEQDNLYEKEGAVASELETKLKAWEASLPSYKDKEYDFPPEIDKETQERIKKTGYW